MSWLILTLAILSEVAGTIALRIATAAGRAWYALVLAGYAISFVLLSAALRRGIGIGVAYGVWTAGGVALIAVLSRLLFGEALTGRRVGGIGLIAVGVVIVELGTDH
jgi:small multidrug resistance pump